MAAQVSQELEDEITLMQRRIVDEQLAVLIVFEGRNERVQESVVNEFLNFLDPRSVTYSHFTADSMRSPRDFFRPMAHEPAKGKIAVYDRSWYSWIKSVKKMDSIFESISSLERYFAENGIILIKIFLDSAEGEDVTDKKRTSYPDDTFLSDEGDYPVWGRRTSSRVISATGTEFAPWDIIKTETNLTNVTENVIRIFLDRIRGRTESKPRIPKESVVPLYPNPRKDLDLSKTADKYKKELEKLTAELNRLQYRLAKSDLSLVILFEGWDAAGKGGTIKRVTRALNPRGYYVNPVAAPTGAESLHTYLWRFAVRMPKTGHISIYDRSWYGRMMVEPIEKFCTEAEYDRSAREIRSFEKQMAGSRCIILKFWMEISKDEQLARFKAREENPVKRYKITEEDWRNREKWDIYEEYIDRMISATNTEYAPWIAVESEDKKYGRLKVLKTIVDALSERLD
ncbi:MAG: hypothetical protein J5494_06810 [Candidatus Methanomethylophilaceae archaeon]|nr:hypothetical protein [Candidatus Methanomethylophilaceae archaeon]